MSFWILAITPVDDWNASLKEDAWLTEANQPFFPSSIPMTVDQIHSVLGLVFLVLCSLIGQIVVTERIA
jgi:hypothetical protein